MIGRIRIVLGFKCQGAAMLVRFAALPVKRSIEEIAGVELNGGLGGEDFDDPPRFRIADPCGKFQAAAGAVENPVVIVAAAELDLFVIGGNALADRVGLAKIERRAVYF